MFDFKFFPFEYHLLLAPKELLEFKKKYPGILYDAKFYLDAFSDWVVDISFMSDDDHELFLDWYRTLDY